MSLFVVLRPIISISIDVGFSNICYCGLICELINISVNEISISVNVGLFVVFKWTEYQYFGNIVLRHIPRPIS